MITLQEESILHMDTSYTGNSFFFQFKRHFKKRWKLSHEGWEHFQDHFLLFFCTKRVDIQSQHQQTTGTFKAYSLLLTSFLKQMSDLITRDRRACEVSFIPLAREHTLERSASRKSVRGVSTSCSNRLKRRRAGASTS